MEFFSKEILLGLTVQEFLLHLLNLVILFTVLYLLLYKPVKKFMQNRDEKYKTADENYKVAVQKTESAEDDAAKIIDEARQQAAEIAEEAHEKAMSQAREIIDGANDEAEKIRTEAALEGKKAMAKEKEDLYYSISELAVEMSKKLIGREIKSADNDAFIDNMLEGMKQKDEEKKDA